MSLPQTLAHQLPDIPRYVEARDILLSGDCNIFGLDQSPELAFILQYPPDRTLFVIGKPSPSALQQALDANDNDGDIIALPEHADWLTPLLPAWTRSTILLHQLQHPERLPSPSESKTDFVTLDTLNPTQIPADLFQELTDAAASSLIAVSFANDQPVAFCYCSALTETQWDISIDTLPAYRRKGHAARAVAHMLHYQHTQGRQPVWAAIEQNPASWQLAQKLGFVPIDELVLFERHPEKE